MQVIIKLDFGRKVTLKVVYTFKNSLNILQWIMLGLIDIIFKEKISRKVKYENVYLHAFTD